MTALDAEHSSPEISPIAPAKFRLGYRPALDGIRGIAVLAVMLYHLLWPVRPISPQAALAGGFLGVDVFFVLSGFLITATLVQEFQTRSAIDLKAFWMRRALRLMPALLVVLLGLLVLGLLVDAGVLHRGQGVFNPPVQRPGQGLQPLPYWPGVVTILLPISNFVIIGGHYLEPLAVAWSLAVEDQFYLIWPFTLLFLLRRCSLKSVAFIISFAVPAFLLWRFSAYYGVLSLGGEGSWLGEGIYHRPDTRAEQLLAGCALALLAIVGLLPRREIAKRIAAFAGWISGVLLLALFFTTELDDEWVLSLGFSLVALATTAVLMHVVVEPGALMARALSWPILVGIGQLSYAIYLWHNVWIWYAPGTALQSSGFVVIFTAISAILSWFLIEQPALRMKRRYERGPDTVSTTGDAGTIRPRLSRRDLIPLAGTATLALFVAPLLMVAEPFRARFALSQQPTRDVEVLTSGAIKGEPTTSRAARMIPNATRVTREKGPRSDRKSGRPRASATPGPRHTRKQKKDQR